MRKPPEADALRRAMRVYAVVNVHGPAVSLDALFAGQVSTIQLRDKADRSAWVMESAARIRRRRESSQSSIKLVVNDSLPLALAAQADGLHVGQRDGQVATLRAQARAAGRDDLIIGVSVTTTAEANAAVAAGADYVSVSPVFDTASKPDAPKGVGLVGVRRLREALPSVPMVAIGGLRGERISQVVAAGADGVAFVSLLQGDAVANLRAVEAAVAKGFSERQAARGP